MDDRTDDSLFGPDDMAGASGAYRVLARKYRPIRFEDLIGQEPMVQTLRNAFAKGRIAQAYMLTGVRGVGKTTTARIIARALNYQTEDGAVPGPTLDMPDFGIHCREILESRHVDVLEMDAASNTGIDNIREIIEAVRYKPSSARYKVYIVDEVHMLSKAAFNGLLKTLEEPPEHVKFIFATTEIRKVPITVLSRCQRFDLRRVEAERLVAHLAGIAERESVEADTEALAMIARAGEGSVRDALSLLDQAMAHGDGTVTAAATRDMLGVADRGRVIDLFEALMRGDVATALAEFQAQYDEGAEPAAVLTDLARFVHLATRLKIVPGAGDDRALSEVERDRGGVIAERLGMADLTRCWQILLKAIPEVSASLLQKQAADMVLVRLAYASTLPSPEEALKALDTGADAALGGGSGQATPASPAAGGVGRGGTALAAAPRTAVMAAPRPDAVSSPDAAPRMTLVADSATDPGLSPPVRQAAATQAPVPDGPAIDRLEDIVALAEERRDRLMATQIERYVRLVTLQPGRLELNLDAGAPADFLQTLSRRLQDWTGARWMVTLSHEPGAEPLRVQAELARQAMVDDIRDHPGVAAILARFPGAQIVDVRFPKAEDDTPPDLLEDPDIEPDDEDDAL